MDYNTITLAELKNVIHHDKNIGYIAICATAWHLTGIQAFISMKEKEKNESLNGIILLKKHPTKGYLLDPCLVSAKFNNAKCFYFDNVEKEKKLSFRRADNLATERVYIISANSPSIPLASLCLKEGIRNVSLVVVDEGISCYFSKFHWIKEKYYETKSLTSTTVLVSKYIAIDAFKALCGLKQIDFLLMKHTNKGLISNDTVVDAYRKVVLAREKVNIHFNPNSKYILFLTQPLFEDNLIEKKVLVEFYKDISQICESCGFTLFFKLHPREKRSTIYLEGGLNVVNDNTDAETFLYALTQKPEYILGCFTTSLVSLKLYFSMQTISVNNILATYNIPNNLKEILNGFDRNFGNMLKIPQKDELLLLLEKK